MEGGFGSWMYRGGIETPIVMVTARDKMRWQQSVRVGKASQANRRKNKRRDESGPTVFIQLSLEEIWRISLF